MKLAYRLLTIVMIVTSIFFISLAQGSNNIASNQSSNSTQFNTTATWTQVVGGNLSLETGTGYTYVIVSISSRVNATGAYLYARIMRDGTEIGRYNVTTDVYEGVNSFVVNQTETAGTHQYGLELSSTSGKRGIVYKWSMNVLYLKTGEYLSLADIGDVIPSVDDTKYLGNNSYRWNSTYTTKLFFNKIGYLTGATDAQIGEVSAPIPVIFVTDVNATTGNFTGSVLGTWQGSAVTDAYISSASTWNDKTTLAAVNSSADVYYINAQNVTSGELSNARLTSTVAITSDSVTNFSNDLTVKRLAILTNSGYSYILDPTSNGLIISPDSTVYGNQSPVDGVLGIKPHGGVSVANFYLYSDTGATKFYAFEVSNTTNNIYLRRNSAASGGKFYISDSGALPIDLVIRGNTYPASNDTYTSGTDALRWSTIYADDINFLGTLTGNLNAANLTGTPAALNYPNNTVGSKETTWDTVTGKTTLTIVNNSGQFGSSAQVTGLDTALSGKESTITGGTASQYWNGLKQWITLGIGNITDLPATLNLKVNKTDAGELSGGTLADARLSANIPLINANNIFTNTINKFQYVAPSSNVSYDLGTTLLRWNDIYGQNILANIAAEYVSSGTLADARLSTNIPLINQQNNFTNSAGNRFDGGIGVGSNASGNYGYKAVGAGLRRAYYSEYTGFGGASAFYDTRINNQLATEIGHYDGTNWQYLELTNLSSAADVLAMTGFPPYNPVSVLVTDTFYGSNLTVKTIQNAGAAVGTNLNTSSINFIIDGSGSAITTGIKGDVEVPFQGTVTTARVLADQTGDIAVSVEKDTYANFPPTLDDQIGNFTLSSASKSENTSVGAAVTAGDILRFNVSSVSTVQRVTISLTIQKS